MKNAIIVHGKPKIDKFRNPELLNPSDSNWLPWVKRQLTLAGIFAVVPDMPEPYYPVYRQWQREFARHDVGRETKLVGHSAGAGFILRWLSENQDMEVERAVLVAPWTDPNGKYDEFMRFNISRNLTTRCLGGLAVMYDPGDDVEAMRSVEFIAEKLPDAELVAMPGFGHFMVGNNMAGPEFPELVSKLLD